MKKNLNVIQIKGLKGLVMVAMIGCCLIAGFVAFPGFVIMKLWNIVSEFCVQVPHIGVLQGVLLWGIIVASYFIFRKERIIVCMKTPQGLSEEELKSVFANVKKQAQEDTILQAMIRARENELKLKDESKEIKDEIKSNHS